MRRRRLLARVWDWLRPAPPSTPTWQEVMPGVFARDLTPDEARPWLADQRDALEQRRPWLRPRA